MKGYKYVMKQVKVGNPFSKAVRDSDGDGYINAVDCQPYNKRKQGFLHDVYKQKLENVKQRASSYVQSQARERELRIEREKAMHEARKQNAPKEAEEQLSRERRQREEMFKRRLAYRPVSFHQGLAQTSRALLGRTGEKKGKKHKRKSKHNKPSRRRKSRR